MDRSSQKKSTKLLFKPFSSKHISEKSEGRKDIRNLRKIRHKKLTQNLNLN